MLDAKKCSNLAEREGFEPSVPVTQYARLAIWCLRPLGHLSAVDVYQRAHNATSTPVARPAFWPARLLLQCGHQGYQPHS